MLEYAIPLTGNITEYVETSAASLSEETYTKV